MKALTFLIIVVIFNLINLTNLKAQVTQEWATLVNENNPPKAEQETILLSSMEVIFRVEFIFINYKQSPP